MNSFVKMIIWDHFWSQMNRDPFWALELDLGAGPWSWTLELDPGAGPWSWILELDLGVGPSLDPGAEPWKLTLEFYPGAGPWSLDPGFWILRFGISCFEILKYSLWIPLTKSSFGTMVGHRSTQTHFEQIVCSIEISTLWPWTLDPRRWIPSFNRNTCWNTTKWILR